MIEPHEFAQRHKLDMLTPLLTISKAMRCTRCGAVQNVTTRPNQMTRGELATAHGKRGANRSTDHERRRSWLDWTAKRA
jgi:hypothetical protein